jgi:hypothetical protein
LRYGNKGTYKKFCVNGYTSIKEKSMAFSKELQDEILKDYHGPDDFYGH